VLDAGRVDYVRGIAPLGAVAGWTLREETGVALRPLIENRERIIPVKGGLARVVGEEASAV